MKRSILAMIICFTVFYSALCQAKTTVWLGGRMGYFYFKEIQYDTTLCKDYGFMPGVDTGVALNKGPWWIRGSFDFNITHGATYKGQAQVGEPVKFNNEHEIIWVAEGNIGYSFAADLTWGIIYITPYTGVGYRHWSRGQADSETGNYREVYKWVFIPVGLNVIYDSDVKAWSGGIDLAMLFPISPRVDAHLHELVPSMQDIELRPQWRPGFRVQLPLFYSLNSHWGVYIIPQYTYWALEESKIEEQMGWQLYEPASSTHYFCVRAGISYRF